MNKLILASDNAHKFREFSEILSGTDTEVILRSAAGCSFEIEETGNTFAENAFLKAKCVTDYTGMAAVAVGYYNHDHTHCSLKGARVNAGSVAKGLKKNNSPLTSLLKKNPGIYVLPVKYK